MPNVKEGVHRISLRGQSVTLLPDARVVLLPDGFEPTQDWEVKRSGKYYTIRQPRADQYIGYDDTPDLYEPLTAGPKKQEWLLLDGPEGTITLAVPPDKSPTPLTLGLSPVLIFPPMLALSEPFRIDEGWKFRPA